METTTREEYVTLKTGARVALKYSVGLAACYVLLFAIGKMTGLVKVIELRYVNYVFASFFCYKAMGEIYSTHKFTDLYYSSYLVTILTTGMAQLWFCILFFIYLNIDQSLTNYFISKVPWDIVMPKFSLAVLLFAEGIGVSSILSLFLIQFFDWKNHVQDV